MPKITHYLRVKKKQDKYLFQLLVNKTREEKQTIHPGLDFKAKINKWFVFSKINFTLISNHKKLNRKISRQELSSPVAKLNTI